MSFEALHTQELSLIQAIQELRTPFLDQLMHLLRFFDTMPFYLLLITIVWYGYQQKCGARLLVLLVLNITVNSALKLYFAQPRPYVIQPEIGLAQAQFFGFPSGAGQLLSSLFGFLVLSLRKPLFTLFSILFVLLVCFSRVYLGIHFLSDIVGGWIFGLLLLALFWYLAPFTERFLSQRSRMTQCALALLATLLLSLLPLGAKTFLFLLPGASIGLIFGKTLPFSPLKQRLAGIFLGCAGTLLILTIFDHTPLYSWVTFFLVSLWLSFGVPLALGPVKE